MYIYATCQQVLLMEYIKSHTLSRLIKNRWIDRILCTWRFLILLTTWRPVRLSATGSSTAERRAPVLPMNQPSDGLQSSE
jgi:hypothetical protein